MYQKTVRSLDALAHLLAQDFLKQTRKKLYVYSNDDDNFFLVLEKPLNHYEALQAIYKDLTPFYSGSIKQLKIMVGQIPLVLDTEAPHADR